VTSAQEKLIEEKMRFARKACKDTNTYTAEDEFWDLVSSGSDSLLENQNYVRSIFPAISWNRS
jgi:hypothetical protein